MGREADRPFERLAPGDFRTLPVLPDDYGLLADAIVDHLAQSTNDAVGHDGGSRGLVRLALVVREYLDALDAYLDALGAAPSGTERRSHASEGAAYLDRLGRAEAMLRHAICPILRRDDRPDGGS